jgi:hypothetical protein
MEPLTIEARFCGPPGMANGGYAVGRIAAHGTGAQRVRLQAPLPLDVPLGVSRDEAGRVELRDADRLIAWAEPAEVDLEVPSPPTFEEAVAASTRSVVHHSHPFPGCFVCGTDRADEEGLRLFAGPVGTAGIVATPWTPHASLADGGDALVRAEFVYAALDCPGYLAANDTGIPMLLGQMTARVDSRPRIGERCVVIGWKLAGSGRKTDVGTAVFGENGRQLGLAHGTWLEPRRD